VSDGQVNFVVPADTVTGTAQIVVANAIGASPAIRSAGVAASPGVFFDATSGYECGVDFEHRGDNESAAGEEGEYIEIYCTGLGATRSIQRFQGAGDGAAGYGVLGNLPLPAAFSGLSPSFRHSTRSMYEIPPGLSPAT
jgi:uncharacterized protein (TIGR03437 family)